MCKKKGVVCKSCVKSVEGCFLLYCVNWFSFGSLLLGG